MANRRLLSGVAALALAFSTGHAQTLPPAFEVAAIHLTAPNQLDAPVGCRSDPGMLQCNNVTLKRCIVGAYGILSDRVLGGPDWISADRYQISARAAQAADEKAMMAMFQTLLAERFKLVLHKELRPAQAMVLELAAGGHKLQLPDGGDKHSWRNLHDRLEATKITMAEFAGIMSRNLNLPIIDRTGLTGAFNFTLTWNPKDADALSHGEGLDVLRSEIPNAAARQLGLTLKFKKIPVDFLVIDRAEKPSLAAN